MNASIIRFDCDLRGCYKDMDMLGTLDRHFIAYSPEDVMCRLKTEGINKSANTGRFERRAVSLEDKSSAMTNVTMLSGMW